MPKLKSVENNIKAAIAATKTAGKRMRWSAGGGLSLVVTPSGGAQWAYQGRDADGVLRTRALGSADPNDPNAFNLTEARDRRHRKRAELKSGTAPAVRGTVNAAAATMSGKAPTEGGGTFGETVIAYLDDKAPHWRGGRHGDEAAAYKRTLLDRGKFAGMPLASVDITAVREHLRPYDGKPTSVKVRTRIMAVLDWAAALGKRVGDNPARVVAKALPNVREAVEHKAIEWRGAPAFYTAVSAIDTAAGRALTFMMLVPGRSNEIAGMRWSEIEGDVWTCPAERAKEGKAYRMPLSSQALALLNLQRGADDVFVWGTHLRHGIMADLTRGFKKSGQFAVTPHGLRATFVMWASDQGYPQDLRLAAIAHSISDKKSDASYDRGDLFELRRKMMQAWADFVVPQTAVHQAERSAA